MSSICKNIYIKQVITNTINITVDYIQKLQISAYLVYVILTTYIFTDQY